MKTLYKILLFGFCTVLFFESLIEFSKGNTANGLLLLGVQTIICNLDIWEG